MSVTSTDKKPTKYFIVPSLSDPARPILREMIAIAVYYKSNYLGQKKAINPNNIIGIPSMDPIPVIVKITPKTTLNKPIAFLVGS